MEDVVNLEDTMVGRLSFVLVIYLRRRGNEGSVD